MIVENKITVSLMGLSVSVHIDKESYNRVVKYKLRWFESTLAEKMFSGTRRNEQMYLMLNVND